MIGMNAMAKYIVYTTWYHEKGLRPAEEMQDGMRKNVKALSPAMFFGGRWMITITNLLRFILQKMQQKSIDWSWKNFVKTVQVSTLSRWWKKLWVQ